MTSINFDQIIDRSTSDSIKWRLYEPSVLPMWVADMDFKTPEAIIQALQERVAEGVFGYAAEVDGLKDAIIERLETQYSWHVKAEDILFLPGVVNGFNLVSQALGQPGTGLLIQPPVYPPFFSASENANMISIQSQMALGKAQRFEVDWDDFEQASNRNVSMFLLCNPHNPLGRVFEVDELTRMAKSCLSKGILICSDEIHCDLIYSGHHHIPIASLDAEIAMNTVTLMAPSKTFNIPGLGFSFAIVQNRDLRDKIKQAQKGLLSHANILGMVAARAAYQNGWPWLNELLAYLEENRNFLAETVKQQLPGIQMIIPEGTYLAWLDCTRTGIHGDPYKFFLEEAKVGLNDGHAFGSGGEGFVRLNFGCPKALLQEGLNRMQVALEKLKG